MSVLQFIRQYKKYVDNAIDRRRLRLNFSRVLTAQG
jgi:hypothetical protein